MDDAALRQRLQAFGVDVGPINESTRQLYVRLLASRQRQPLALACPQQRQNRLRETHPQGSDSSEKGIVSFEEDFFSTNNYLADALPCDEPTESEGSALSTVVGETLGWFGAGVVSFCRNALGLNKAHAQDCVQEEPAPEEDDILDKTSSQAARNARPGNEKEQDRVSQKRPVRRSAQKVQLDRSGTESVGDNRSSERDQVANAHDFRLKRKGSPPKALVRRALHDGHSPKKQAVLDGRPAAALPRYHGMADWELRAEDIDIMRRPGTRERWKLGQGGFGQVFKALKDGVDPVAVKMYRVLPGRSVQGAMSEFRQEVEMISHLRHRHVVQFYGAYTTEDGLMCLVTELMDLDLYQGLHRGGGRWRWHGGAGPNVLVDVACGLQYLHSLRPPVVHRDLKSPNVLLLESGLAKIGDVGLAKLKVDSLMTPQHGYTAAWAAPEVIYRRRATEKVDIWSFGVVLWEVVTGKVPTLGKQLILPASCPAAVRQLMKDCLHQHSDQRPSAKDTVLCLRACLAKNV